MNRDPESQYARYDSLMPRTKQGLLVSLNPLSGLLVSPTCLGMLYGPTLHKLGRYWASSVSQAFLKYYKRFSSVS